MILKEEGPDHDKIFTTALYFGEDLVAEGAGRSKQEAETNAARAGLVTKGWMEKD
jgi:ribonuclease-3